ncbi:MAG: thiamine-phosphate kinase [Legionellaceae bacterium]|nr:thiamine-phosphate kinase [Legionellaceae bacterium]
MVIYSMLSESSIIQTLQSHFPEQIGDDAAIFPFIHNESYVISKDLLIENSHFRLRYQTPESLAHKSLHVNLSDLAAMGATPQYVLLGLSIPSHFEPHIQTFLNAFSSACKAASVLLLGGDTTGASETFAISITAIGTIKNEYIKLRSTASAHDLLCVAGQIGDAHLGLTALENNHAAHLNYKNRFLNPNARIAEGVWLGQQTAVNSMMDVSDGIFIDLTRMCQASDLGCILNLDTFMPDISFINMCRTLNLEPINVQLEGGEDYSLMFSVSPDAYEKLADAFKKQFQYSLKCIGTFQTGQGITLMQNHHPIEQDITPFSHFKP